MLFRILSFPSSRMVTLRFMMVPAQKRPQTSRDASIEIKVPLLLRLFITRPMQSAIRDLIIRVGSAYWG